MALAAVAWGQARPASRSASIAGVVVDDATGAPIPRAVVTLTTKSADPSDAVAWTDGRGAFSFSLVPPGSYFLAARFHGYEAARFGAAREGEAPEVLTLAAGEARQTVIRLGRVGSIAGTVSDADGDPVSGVQVTVLVAGFHRRKPQYRARTGAATDRRGRYRISGLPPGKYYVMIVPQPWPQPPAPAEVVRGEPQDLRYPTQFYPNADRISAASPLTLASGANLEGIDFSLSPQPATKIEGKAIVPVEIDTANASLTVMTGREDDPSQFGGWTGGAARPDGSFEVNNLLPGPYLVVAQVTAQGRLYRGVEHVEVGSSPAAVTIRLEPAVEISGSVRLEGASDPPPAFRVRLTAGDGVLLLNTAQPEAEVKPDGSFRISNVPPGVWDIGVDPVPKGGYIKSMRLGDQDVLTEEMAIRSDTTAPLNIVVSARGGVVDGVVTGAKKAYVLLAPTGRFENVWTFYRTEPVDEDGHYEIRGIVPGSYTLYALERMRTDPAQDPDFVKSLGVPGEPVEVPEGGHVTRDLALVPQAPLAEAK